MSTKISKNNNTRYAVLEPDNNGWVSVQNYKSVYSVYEILKVI